MVAGKEITSKTIMNAYTQELLDARAYALSLSEPNNCVVAEIGYSNGDITQIAGERAVLGCYTKGETRHCSVILEGIRLIVAADLKNPERDFMFEKKKDSLLIRSNYKDEFTVLSDGEARKVKYIELKKSSY